MPFFNARYQPRLTFLCLDDVDETGHRYGFGREYDEAIRGVDMRVRRVLRALKDEDHMLERTLVFVVSDHGRRLRSGKVHGWFTTEEVATFWMVG